MEKTTRKCLNCQKNFEVNRKDKKFCSQKCRTRYNASKRYNALKNNPNFKRKARDTWNKWIKTHKKEFNEKMRIYMKEKLKEDKYREKQKEYSNTPASKLRKKKYYQEHKKEITEKRKDYHKKYHQTHKDKINQKFYDWVKSEEGRKYYKEYEKNRRPKRKKYFQDYWKKKKEKENQEVNNPLDTQAPVVK
jgi:hypothetical protein